MADAVPSVRCALSGETWGLPDLVAGLTASDAAPLRPFDDVSLGFCAELSKALFAADGVRAHPEIVSLAYWLRPASIKRAQSAFAELGDERMVLVPRGCAYHVTPANVDTIFVYSWVLSLLVGNVNVVRLSSRGSAVVDLLLGIVGNVLARPDMAAVALRNRLIAGDHDDRVTAALSSIADVRVLWGGDDTVRRLRAFPLPLRGRDVTFPDRHSLALFSAPAVVAATDEELAALAGAFFNDAYWFDQAACSSPRLIVWHDPDGDAAGTARARLHEAVGAELVRRGHEVATGLAIAKMVHGFRTIAEQAVGEYSAPTNEATWVLLGDLSAYSRAHCGGGLFHEFVTTDLVATLGDFVTSADQTAGCFGLTTEQARRIAEALNGRGIDRFVEVGAALEFDRVWDGYDLLQEFARRVTLPAGAGPRA